MLYMIDAYKGVAHVTPEQVGDYNVGITGGGCVFNVGEKLRAEVVNSNKIRIYDGAFLFQGRRSGITPGSYEDVTIENGTQDQKRNDIIAAKYIKDGTTSKENISLVVLKGTPGTTAIDPTITEGDIRDGGSACYMPLYRVKLNGINIDGVEQLFKSRKSFEEIEAELTELNDNLASPDSGETVGSIAQVPAGGSDQKTICTCTKTGIVLVFARCTFPSDYGDNRQLFSVSKNGTEMARIDSKDYMSGLSLRRDISTFVLCKPGDVITCSAVNSSGSAKQLIFDYRYTEIGV